MTRVCHLLVLICCTLFYQRAIAQAELQKIIPLSPNAASISKYGEMPVSHFTGIPNISIPLYEVKSKELGISLGLSYHAGGNKVEEVPSWVGMGWSLSGAPVISRSVRGIPDENTGGFFSRLTTVIIRDPSRSPIVNINPPVTIKTIRDDDYFNDLWWKEGYFTGIYKNEIDPEADIFNYTLPNKSGKFYWDQVTERFHTYPWSNIKISYNAYSFEIIDDDGTVYTFPSSLQEKSSTSGVSQGEQITSSWWATKMCNANKTDSISFVYDFEGQVNYTLNPNIKTVWGNCSNAINSSIVYTGAYTLSEVLFAGGSVQLEKYTEARDDLSGGHALKAIKVYDAQLQLIKKVDLTYQYRDGGVPANYSPTLGKRLLLKQIAETGSNNTAGGKHQFLYDSLISFPHRLSMAQDYWGFFNGAYGNTELTPTANYTTATNTLIQIPGADREVNPSYSQFGILRKIIYPTGGWTTFEYENNVAHNSELPPSTLTQMAALEYGEAEPGTNTFIDTFAINVPPNPYLNSNQGGSIVSSDIGALGCNLNGVSSTCATLTVRGLDNTNSNIYYYVSSNTQFALPNGNYEIKAVFNQDPPEYQNFYFVLTWEVLDTTKTNFLVGGLRVKTIRNFDGQGKSLFKELKYTKRLDADTSSGDIFGKPYFIGYDDFWTAEGGYCRRMLAQSNQNVVSHSGSFIGYKTVYEFVDSLGSSGMTEYQFTHEKDMMDAQSPFPPAYSLAVFRGQPFKTTVFKKEGSHYWPVSRVTNEYTAKIFDSLSTYCIKAKLTKAAVLEGFTVVSPPEYDWQYYDFAPAWSALSKKTERLFHPTDTTQFLETITNYEYSPQHFGLVRSSVSNSKGQVMEATTYYTPDVSLTGSAESARQALLQKNVLTAVLKQEKKIANVSAEVVETQYKGFHSGAVVKPELVRISKSGGPLETRVEFVDYSAGGNLLTQKKTADLPASYIWGYGNNYPVAEIAGKSYSDAVSQSGIDLGVLNSLTTSENDKRAELAKLRNLTGTLVTTYTFKPLVGMTSQTDPKGRTTYYEYDDLGRLKLIKDHDGHVVKKFDYKYAD